MPVDLSKRAPQLGQSANMTLVVFIHYQNKSEHKIKRGQQILTGFLILDNNNKLVVRIYIKNITAIAHQATFHASFYHKMLCMQINLLRQFSIMHKPENYDVSYNQNWSRLNKSWTLRHQFYLQLSSLY